MTMTPVRTRTVTALITLLAALVLGLTPSADASTPIVIPSEPVVDIGVPSSFARLGGTDRIATAVAISQASHAPGVGVAYVARADDFPDALAAGPVAQATGGPILLTPTTELAAATAAELNRLQPGRVVVLGGAEAVSNAVYEVLAEDHAVVERVGGADRYETAAYVTGLLGDLDVVYIATGERFPDALVGAAAAGKESGGVLLTGSNHLPDHTLYKLWTLTPDRIVILGGEQAVSSVVEKALIDADSGGVSRIFGATRYDTAVAVSEALYGRGAGEVFVASGENFPDALVVSAITGTAPLLLTPRDELPTVVADEYDALNATRTTIVGGEAAVSRAVADRLVEVAAD